MKRRFNEPERRWSENFIYDIKGHGHLVARDDKKALEAQVEALKVQLLAHSKELKKLIETQSTEIIDAAIELILERAARAGGSHLPDPAKLREELRKGLSRGKDEEPKVSLLFKDVTYEQTKNDGFRKLVDKALPSHKRKQLGAWTEHYEAARKAVGAVDANGRG